MFNEELGESDLAAEIDEVGEEGPPDAAVLARDERVVPLLPAAGGWDGGLGDLDLGEPVGAEEEDCDDDSQTSNACTEDAVEGDDGAELVAAGRGLAGHEAAAGTGRVRRRSDFRGVEVEDEGVGQKGSHDGTDTSPCLGNQDAQGGLAFRTTIDSVWVGGALQSRDTKADDEVGANHTPKRAVGGADRHQFISESQNEQTQGHRNAIAALLDQGPTHEERAGDVGEVVTRGENGGLLTGDPHGYLDMVVHDVEEAVGETPHEEQKERGDGDGEDGLPGGKGMTASGLAMLNVEALDALDGGGDELESHLKECAVVCVVE